MVQFVERKPRVHGAAGTWKSRACPGAGAIQSFMQESERTLGLRVGHVSSEAGAELGTQGPVGT